MSLYAILYSRRLFSTAAGELGDGRSISVGEYVNKAWDRWRAQLEPAGNARYSRFGNGRDVVRSSITDFLCSNAMCQLELMNKVVRRGFQS